MSTPKQLYLEITRRCNFACRYCYQARPPRGGEMSARRRLQIIDQFVELGGSSLVISGGEPLMERSLVPLVESAAERLPVTIVTNASLLEGKTLERLASRGNVTFQVSLDAPDAETQARLRPSRDGRCAFAGVERLLAMGLASRIAVNTVVTRLNLDTALRLIPWAWEKGIPAVHFAPLTMAGRARARRELLRPDDGELTAFYERLLLEALKFTGRVQVFGNLSRRARALLKEGRNDSPCPLGEKIRIDCGGDVFPCPQMLSTRLAVGNVFSAPLDEALGGSKLEKLRERAERRADAVAQCAQCRWKALCRAGCMASAIHEHGRAGAPDPRCAVIAESFRSAGELLPTAPRRKEKEGRIPAHLRREVAQLLSGRYRRFQVKGSSMEPALAAGDTVFIEKKKEGIREGDVILYRRDGDYFIHRVIRIEDIRSSRAYICKGDGAPDFDPPVGEGDVMGRVVSAERGGSHVRLEGGSPLPVDHGALGRYFSRLGLGLCSVRELEQSGVPGATANRAEILRRNGRLEEGRRLMEASLAGLPTAHGFNVLGNILVDMGEMAAAEEAYERAAALDGELPFVWVNLGWVHARLGRAADAERCYGKALLLDPSHPPALRCLGVLRLGQEKLEEAGRYLEEALTRREGDADAAYALGLVRARQGNLSEAARLFWKVLSLAPGHRGARAGLLALHGDHIPRAGVSDE